jgi:hypothetical protein
MSKRSNDWVTPMYRKAVKKCLKQLDLTPAKGYWSSALGARIDGQRDVLKKLQGINQVYSAIAASNGIKLDLFDVTVDEDPFEDALGEMPA